MTRSFFLPTDALPVLVRRRLRFRSSGPAPGRARSTTILHAGLFALSVLFLPLAHAAPSEGKPSQPDHRDQALDYILNLPKTNPYRAILLRHQTLSLGDRSALYAWVNGSSEFDAPRPALTAAQKSLVRELSSGLVSAASASPTTVDDWPLLPDPEDPDHPAKATVPGIGNLKDLAKLAAKEAEALPPDKAIATYAAIAQLGRQQRAGATTIEQLTGVAIEGIAQTGVATRLGEFSADELARLSSAWSHLKPRPGNAQSLAGERDLFFRPILENIIAPGLRELLDHAESPEEQTAGGDENASDPLKFLRLSGLIDLGGGRHKIIVQDMRGGEFTAVELGETTQGITLATVDYEKRFAIIRHGSREALVHLESKRIVPRPSAVARLREMLGYLDGSPEEQDAELKRILEKLRDTPGGVDAYVRDVLAAYQAKIDRDLAFAEKVRLPATAETGPAPDGPIARMLTPSFGRLARALNSYATQTAMLQAAIHHRLAQLGAADPASAPADPWSDDGKGFDLQPASDGAGFVLTSRYEVRPGQPLAYKFAAPDAGFVRPPSGP